MKKQLLYTIFSLFLMSFLPVFAQAPTCGSLFTNPEGPNVSYLNNENVTTTICPTNIGEQVTVNFNAFDLESNFDFLKVYNGSDTSAPLIANLTGSIIPSALTANNSSGCLTFVFTSDNSVVHLGWIAIVSCGLAPTCPNPAQLSATNSTQNSTTLSWGENGIASTWEVIAIPNGGLPSSSSVGTITTTNPFVVSGLNPASVYSLYVRSVCSTNDVSLWSTGLSINTSPASLPPPVCGGVFTDSGGISSDYSNNENSTTVICSDNANDVVTVSFTSFSIESCCDHLSVYDGADSSAPLLGTYQGTTIPSNITSSIPGGCLTLVFTSDSSVTNPGWTANVTCSPITTCLTPTNLTASNSNNSIGFGTVGWNEMGSSTQWEVIAIPCGVAAPISSSVGILTSSNPYTFSGLTESCYNFYVRAICSSSNVSQWSLPITFSTTAQALAPIVTNTSQYTSEQLVTDVLVNNPCISISNVTSITGTNFGSTNGIGYFTNTNPTFPIQSGIILSTGDALHAPGPNTSILSDGDPSWIGDPQLEAIVSTATGQPMYSFNATKLEFDFSSLNEFMSFNFLFASDEYGVFQCDYSDAFAFLLTDLTTGVTTNLAVVPGTTTPVSVVTIRDIVNNTGCPSENQGFFGAYNDGANIYASATNFNGQTVEMTASSIIIANHPYHIKLVVADRGDALFDSAVFIEAGSFSAGPPQCNDKVQLVAFIDENNNGIKDNNEVNFSYGSFSTQENNSGPITNVTSPFGSYTIYDSDPNNTYDFGYAINPEYAPYYTLSTTNYNDIDISLNPNQILYFPITLTQGFNDVTVSLTPITPPVPGFSYTNKIVYTNLGVTSTSGTVSFTKDPAVTINTVSQAGVINNATGFTYDYTNLTPYETRNIYVNMNVPAIPTVNLGDLLTDNASITAISNDVNLNNNSFSNSQIVVDSYDPNEKTEAHGEKILYSSFTTNDYLYYTIHFQNTGTTNAISVRLEDVLDSRIDETSIRMISASHNYVMERINNNLTWKFDYINLVSSLQDQELSKGYVTFKVKLKPGFALGDIVPNTANIYFDSNPPITTNTFNTQFVTTLGTTSFDTTNFLLYPNPTNTFVQIGLQNTTESLESISIHDVLGKAIKTFSNLSTNLLTVDVSDLSKGVYFVEIKTQNNLKQIKKLLIK